MSHLEVFFQVYEHQKIVGFRLQRDFFTECSEPPGAVRCGQLTEAFRWSKSALRCTPLSNLDAVVTEHQSTAMLLAGSGERVIIVSPTTPLETRPSRVCAAWT